jgi:hypothetical protein
MCDKLLNLAVGVPLAQGSPTMFVFPILVVIGLVFLLIFLGSVTARFASRAEYGSARIPPWRKVGWSPLRITMYLSATLSLLFAVMVLSIVESFPTHGWRCRTRTTTVRAVDAQTGLPIPIDLRDESDAGDPFLVREFTSTERKPDEAEIRWNNADIPFYVTSDGYEKKPLDLTPASPQTIVVRLSRSEAK